MGLLDGLFSAIIGRLAGSAASDLSNAITAAQRELQEKSEEIERARASGEAAASSRGGPPPRSGASRSDAASRKAAAPERRAAAQRSTAASNARRASHDSAPKYSRDDEPIDLSSSQQSSVYTGRVVFVGPKFAKIETPSFKAVVFLGEMSNEFIGSAADVLSEGEEVECVLVERSKKNPDEWVVSLAAVREARIREALAALEPGDTVEGVVTHISNRYVELDCGGVPARVPLEELSWGRIRHPGDAVQLHQRCKGKLQSINLPTEWLRNKKARNAHMVLSLRACTPFPLSPLVGMHFSARPFRLWAAPRRPVECDALVLFVLQELNDGLSLGELTTITGLPAPALDAVLALLETHGLAQGQTLTHRGSALADAIRLADAANEQPIRGLFVSAAPAALKFQSVDVVRAQPEYPGTWPRPPYNRREENQFTRATDESLPVTLFSAWVGAERARGLNDIWANPAVSVYVRHEGSRPWTTVQLQVPEYWILAGMWREFEPVGTPPFCPVDIPDYCRNFLLVRLTLSVQAGDAASESRIVYFEPTTRTCWSRQSGGKVQEIEYAHSGFPDLPDVCDMGVNVPSDATVQISPVWVNVEIRS